MSTTEQLNTEQVKVQIGWDEDGNECWFVPLEHYNLIQNKLAEAERKLRQLLAKVEQCEREVKWAERELLWVLEGNKAEEPKND